MALIEMNWEPSRRDLKQFAGIWFPAFCAVVGGLVAYHAEAWTIAAGIWCGGAVIGIAGLIAPVVIRPDQLLDDDRHRIVPASRAYPPGKGLRTLKPGRGIDHLYRGLELG